MDRPKSGLIVFPFFPPFLLFPFCIWGLNPNFFDKKRGFLRKSEEKEKRKKESGFWRVARGRSGAEPLRLPRVRPFMSAVFLLDQVLACTESATSEYSTTSQCPSALLGRPGRVKFILNSLRWGKKLTHLSILDHHCLAT